MASRIIFVLMVCIFSSNAWAMINWFEPEVVPEKVYRKNRRVIRFSGTTKPGTLVRIRNNKVKMYLDDGKFRWALLPQKNKIQFPVVGGDDGSFAFNLYLPTVPVEIPVEVKQEGAQWVPFSLNFRVPDEGAADDFEALEQSYSAAANQDSGYEPAVGTYDREKDFGQLLPRRDDEPSTNPFLKTDIRFYIGLGGAWTNMREDAPGAPVLDVGPPVQTLLGFHHDKSTVTIPSWNAGAVYRHNSLWRFEGNLRSTNSDYDPDGFSSAIFADGDASWFELQLAATYYHWKLSGKKQLGIDFGIQYHSLPYYRLREGLANYAYFDNNVYALFAGARLESDREIHWPWEVYARFVLPVSADSAFKMDSGYGFDLGGLMERNLIPGVYVGGWTQLEAIFLNTAFSSTLGEHETEYSMTQFSVGARLSIRF